MNEEEPEFISLTSTIHVPIQIMTISSTWQPHKMCSSNFKSSSHHVCRSCPVQLTLKYALQGCQDWGTLSSKPTTSLHCGRRTKFTKKLREVWQVIFNTKRWNSTYFSVVSRQILKISSERSASHRLMTHLNVTSLSDKAKVLF